MTNGLIMYFAAETAIAVLALISIKNHLGRIADKLEMRESNWNKGYTRGYVDAQREFEMSKEGEDND
jgi:hypothetical protein